MLEKQNLGMVSQFRSYFLYGLIIILPIAATIFIVSLLVQVLTAPLNQLFGGEVFVFFNFLISIGIIVLVGFLSSNFIGKFILGIGEGFIRRVPIINKIYDSSKQIVNAFSLSNKQYMQPVLVEYPRKGLWALGFVTSSIEAVLESKEGENLGKGKVSVFVPTTPNPTSGYFVFLEKSDVHELNMSVEESVKLLMSAGAVSPK